MLKIEKQFKQTKDKILLLSGRKKNRINFSSSFQSNMLINGETITSVMTVAKLQVKLNRFLHPNDYPQRIFEYLVIMFD